MGRGEKTKRGRKKTERGEERMEIERNERERKERKESEEEREKGVYIERETEYRKGRKITKKLMKRKKKADVLTTRL